MKKTLTALIFALSFCNAFAAAERTCPTETLNCRLEKQLPSGGRSLILSTQTHYDGTNSDEPSIPPASCTVSSSLEDQNGNIFNVSIDEADLMTGIYLVKRSNMGSLLPGNTSFKASVGSPFYYRYNDSILTCTLK